MIQLVKIKDADLYPGNIMCGIPQGSVLQPETFILYGNIFNVTDEVGF